MCRDITILLMTHGNLGKELIEIVTMFLKKDPSLVCMGLYEDDRISEYQGRLENLLDEKQKVLILTDMLTAATTRIAAHIAKHKHVEIISGVNLMMLLTALHEKQTHNLSQLTKMVRISAREDIVDIKKRLNKIRKEQIACTKFL